MNDLTSSERTITDSSSMTATYDGSNPFQPTVTFRLLSSEGAMVLTSGGGTPTWRTLEPWDLPGYVEPAPLSAYMELFE